MRSRNISRIVASIAVFLLIGCVHARTTYNVPDNGDPTITIERDNVIRVGQGVQIVEYSKKTGKMKITQLGSEEAASEQLKAMWNSLNRTAQLAIIGAIMGSVVGQPGIGAAAGAGAAQVEKAMSGGEVVEEVVEGAAEAVK